MNQPFFLNRKGGPPLFFLFSEVPGTGYRVLPERFAFGAIAILLTTVKRFYKADSVEAPGTRTPGTLTPVSDFAVVYDVARPRPSQQCRSERHSITFTYIIAN